MVSCAFGEYEVCTDMRGGAIKGRKEGVQWERGKVGRKEGGKERSPTEM
jgi:hypothetical protein